MCAECKGEIERRGNWKRGGGGKVATASGVREEQHAQAAERRMRLARCRMVDESFAESVRAHIQPRFLVTTRSRADTRGWSCGAACAISQAPWLSRSDETLYLGPESLGQWRRRNSFCARADACRPQQTSTEHTLNQAFRLPTRNFPVKMYGRHTTRIIANHNVD